MPAHNRPAASVSASTTHSLVLNSPTEASDTNVYNPYERPRLHGLDLEEKRECSEEEQKGRMEGTERKEAERGRTPSENVAVDILGDTQANKAARGIYAEAERGENKTESRKGSRKMQRHTTGTEKRHLHLLKRVPLSQEDDEEMGEKEEEDAEEEEEEECNNVFLKLDEADGKRTTTIAFSARFFLVVIVCYHLCYSHFLFSLTITPIICS